MSAFNDISGVPASANRYTMTDILRGMWGFDGLVVSDWDAVKQLVAQGVAADRAEAAAKAITAGLDMDMVDDVYRENLEAGRKRTGAGKGAGRSRAAHPACEIPPRAVRKPLYRGAARRAALPVDRGACRGAGAGGREHGIAEKQWCDAACRR